MTAIESKEEISDTDSGIILHSGKNITTVSTSVFHMSYNLGLHNQKPVDLKHQKACVRFFCDVKKMKER